MKNENIEVHFAHLINDFTKSVSAPQLLMIVQRLVYKLLESVNRDRPDEYNEIVLNILRGISDDADTIKKSKEK